MNASVLNSKQQESILHRAINSEYGVKSKIAVLAALCNGIGFSFALTVRNQMNPAQSTQFDDSAASFYGIDGVKAKTYDAKTLACGFVAAQIMMGQAIMQPDPELNGGRNEWAKRYMRTGAGLAQNLFDFQVRNEIGRLEAEVKKIEELTGTSTDLTKRKERIKAEYDASAKTLAVALDEQLKQVYVVFKDAKDEDLWDHIELAFVEMTTDSRKVNLVEIVVPSLERVIKSQQERILSGQYATIDNGMYALMRALRGESKEESKKADTEVAAVQPTA